MLRTLLPLLLAASICASAQQASEPAQQPPAGSDWQRVQALAVGTAVYIQARSSKALCEVISVDAETVICAKETGVGHKSLTFARGDVRTIKLARRGRSGLLGAAIGGGVGAVAGGIQGIGSTRFAVKGAYAMIYGFAGLLAGGPAGYFTDFSASTIYRAR